MRFGVGFIRVKASAMSAKPGPSSSTTTWATPGRTSGFTRTRQTVASGASSHAF